MKKNQMPVSEYAAWLSEELDDDYTASLYEESDPVDDIDETNEDEQLSEELANERAQILETEIYQDEHPTENNDPVEDTGAETIKHEMLKTAIGRIERAARTEQDFENVVACWDKLEQNAVRRVQNHELPRSDVPLEYGRTIDGVVFPKSYMQLHWRQILRGYFLEMIHDCPLEMDELTDSEAISNAIRNLKDEHKLIFYWHFIRQLSCAEIGCMRGQTDRNIRKTRAVIIRKLRKQLSIPR